MDDSGAIDVDELRQLLPHGLDEAAIQTVLKKADCVDDDGMITLSEFKAFLLGD
jgi:Ca2+-binding EF-hand superfamily protein